MRPVLSYGLLVSVVVGMTVGALPLLGGTAAAADAENNCLIAFCSAGAGGEGEGGDATARGGNGGNGGLAAILDVGNVSEDASSSIVRSNITTGDVIAPDVNVDASVGTDPVRVIAGSFPNTSVDVFAPDGSGNAQSGTTGGNGLTADESGGAGGDDTARGGRDNGAGDDTGGDNVFIIGIGIFP